MWKASACRKKNETFLGSNSNDECSSPWGFALETFVEQHF